MLFFNYKLLFFLLLNISFFIKPLHIYYDLIKNTYFKNIFFTLKKIDEKKNCLKQYYKYINNTVYYIKIKQSNTPNILKKNFLFFIQLKLKIIH